MKVAELIRHLGKRLHVVLAPADVPGEYERLFDLVAIAPTGCTPPWRAEFACCDEAETHVSFDLRDVLRVKSVESMCGTGAESREEMIDRVQVLKRHIEAMEHERNALSQRIKQLNGKEEGDAE